MVGVMFQSTLTTVITSPIDEKIIQNNITVLSSFVSIDINGDIQLIELIFSGKVAHKLYESGKVGSIISISGTVKSCLGQLSGRPTPFIQFWVEKLSILNQANTNPSNVGNGNNSDSQNSNVYSFGGFGKRSTKGSNDSSSSSFGSFAERSSNSNSSPNPANTNVKSLIGPNFGCGNQSQSNIPF